MCFFVGLQAPTSSSLAETRKIALMIRWFHWSLPVRHVKNSIWLVVEPTPLKRMSLSVGMMTFPIWWESHDPFMFQTTNHQHLVETTNQPWLSAVFLFNDLKNWCGSFLSHGGTPNHPSHSTIVVLKPMILGSPILGNLQLILDLPIKNGDFPQVMLVYQRVYPIK